MENPDNKPKTETPPAFIHPVDAPLFSKRELGFLALIAVLGAGLYAALRH